MKKIHSLMPELFLFFSLLLYPVYMVKGQDVIVKKNGDEVKAKVEQVLDNEIKYRKAENLTGPVYSIRKTEVFMIRYENGSKDLFDDKPVVVKPEKSSSGSMTITEQDLRPARKATIIGSALVIPILGLGITSGAIYDNPELTIPMGATATLIGAIGIPIVAHMSSKTRKSTGVDGNPGIRLAGWIGYGLALSDAVIILSLATGGTDTSGGPTYSVAVIGSIASILMAIDANQTFRQGNELRKTVSVQPVIGAVKDNMGHQYPTAGIRINF